MLRILPIALVLVTLVLTGCRKMESERPPIHPNLNMDYQPKPTAYRASTFFADGRAMRPPVPGTVARGLLQEDDAFYRGQNAGGGFVTQNPVPLTLEMLERGRVRYEVFCSMCHGDSGDGLGIIMTGGYGYTPAPTFHDERLRGESDGYIYEVISNGVRNMPGYAKQIPVADRWAIVAYTRALQRSQNASMADVPADQRGAIPVAEGPAPDDTSVIETQDDAPADALDDGAAGTATEPAADGNQQ
jgi:mono/diheme cytochrome c family protein